MALLLLQDIVYEYAETDVIIDWPAGMALSTFAGTDQSPGLDVAETAVTDYITNLKAALVKVVNDAQTRQLQVLNAFTTLEMSMLEYIRLNKIDASFIK